MGQALGAVKEAAFISSLHRTFTPPPATICCSRPAIFFTGTEVVLITFARDKHYGQVDICQRGLKEKLIVGKVVKA
jgi:hypothetical protein